MNYSEEDRRTIDQLVDQWISIDPNETSKSQIIGLQKSQDYESLDIKLSKRIAFGTAGLRSCMAPGFAHMNDVTVMQASYGLVQYLIKNNQGETKGISLVVGHDHRYNSQRFAEITASVALSKGLEVLYLGSATSLSPQSRDSKHFGSENDTVHPCYVHTPLVPFTIDHFGASAGVMVTASHNPANDNGYKVYYGNGCQIIPPHDQGIAQSIDENLFPSSDIGIWNIADHFDLGLKQNRLVSVKSDMVQAYLEKLRAKLITNNDITFNFVYTPMHGIGFEIFDKVMGLFNHGHYDVVEEQKIPDPAFPTVRFPNPEEKGALDKAIETAEKQFIPLVIANDPDADRFSVAVKSNDKWVQLTGNEIGILFAVYVIELFGEDDLSDVYILNSTVSSQIFKSIAKAHKFNFQDTLTGFKWIGNKAIDLKKEGKTVPFGYEEAIGFMFDIVNDKDGIAALAVWLQLYQKWFTGTHKTPLDKLAQIYEKYGWYKECNGYYKLNDLRKTDEIFKNIRASFPGPHPSSIGNLTVISWRDLTVGYDSSQPDSKPLLPVDPSSQMITAVLKNSQSNEVRFTCRGSGTEPKLKVYIEGNASSEEDAVSIARDCWKVLRDHWFLPEVNDLEEIVNS